MYDNDFEKFPGSKAETSGNTIPPEQDFDKSFEKGVPEFNDGLSNAASIINYGLDAAARETSVEAVIQGIKNFDASSSDNPLRDLYDSLGIDTKKEFEDMRDESVATKHYRNQFREQYNMPKTEKRSREGFIKAIMDMKELISEVEGADPRYEELRQAARASEKGYFEYAVKDFGLRGLTDLFSVLAKQKAEKSGDASGTESKANNLPGSNTDLENTELKTNLENSDLNINDSASLEQNNTLDSELVNQLPEPNPELFQSNSNQALTSEAIEETIKKKSKSA